jgi:hypothetical protein
MAQCEASANTSVQILAEIRLHSRTESKSADKDMLEGLPTSHEQPSQPISTETKGTSENIRRRTIPPFREIDAGVFEATRLESDENIRKNWPVWKNTLNQLLMRLHLGQNVITNLRLGMVGSAQDEKQMRPTILLVCPESKKRLIEASLTEFVRVAFSPQVDFLVISGKVKPTSGAGAVCTPIEPGDRRDLLVSIKKEVDWDGISIMGSVIFVQSLGSEYFPASTVGGIISVGDYLYGLTVAHSIFRTPTSTGSAGEASDLRVCGHVESYEWSGNEISEAHLKQDIRVVTTIPRWKRTADMEGPAIAMDWMMIRLRKDFMLSNMYQDLETSSTCAVDSWSANIELLTGEVVVCGGITGTQAGILNTSPSSIVYGEASYEVLLIALEYPLGML